MHHEDALAEAQEVDVVLTGAECAVKVKWEWAPNAWYSNKPLPSTVPYELWSLAGKTKQMVDVGVLRFEEIKKGSVAEQTKAAMAYHPYFHLDVRGVPCLSPMDVKLLGGACGHLPRMTSLLRVAISHE